LATRRREEFLAKAQGIKDAKKIKEERMLDARNIEVLE
jgi:uncharacterized protein (DUF2164 family)